MRQSNWSLIFAFHVGLAFTIACRSGEQTSETRTGIGGAKAADTGPAPAASDAPRREIGAGSPSVSGSADRLVPSASGSPLEATAADLPDPDAGSGTDHFADCYEGFSASASPEIDASRLGLLCGPSNGMVERPERLTGVIDETGAEGRHILRARRGECYRIVGSAEEPVDDLEVEIRGPRGDRTSLTNSNARWVVAPANGPLCTNASGAHEIVARTHAGRGRYALRLWGFPRGKTGGSSPHDDAARQ